MAKKKTTQDLVGMRLRKAYQAAGEMGYEAICLTGLEKVYKEHLDPQREYLVLRYERDTVVSVEYFSWS